MTTPTPLSPIQCDILRTLDLTAYGMTFSELLFHITAHKFAIWRALQAMWKGDDRYVKATEATTPRGKPVIRYNVTAKGRKALVEAEMLARQCERETQGGA